MAHEDHLLAVAGRDLLADEARERVGDGDEGVGAMMDTAGGIAILLPRTEPGERHADAAVALSHHARDLAGPERCIVRPAVDEDEGAAARRGGRDLVGDVERHFRDFRQKRKSRKISKYY